MEASLGIEPLFVVVSPCALYALPILDALLSLLYEDSPLQSREISYFQLNEVMSISPRYPQKCLFICQFFHLLKIFSLRFSFLVLMEKYIYHLTRPLY